MVTVLKFPKAIALTERIVKVDVFPVVSKIYGVYKKGHASHILRVAVREEVAATSSSEAMAEVLTDMLDPRWM